MAIVICLGMDIWLKPSQQAKSKLVLGLLHEWLEKRHTIAFGFEVVKGHTYMKGEPTWSSRVERYQILSLDLAVPDVIYTVLHVAC